MSEKSKYKDLIGAYGSDQGTVVSGQWSVDSGQSASGSDEDHNKGGILGGIGYTLAKIGAGGIQAIENLWDYTASGIAKLFGADEWAKSQLENDWMNYITADEWYDPDKVMSFVGDAASGVGNSAVSLGVAAGATALGMPGAGAKALSLSVLGLSAAGGGVKEAYNETGELGGKEYAYGALSGALEVGTEIIGDAAGYGTGKLRELITKPGVKDIAGALTRKEMAKGILKEGAKTFAGEAFEEMLSEAISPYVARITYDPEAEKATPGEVMYAGLVGGVSGLMMGGVGKAFNTAVNFKNGAKAVNNGSEQTILAQARDIAENEHKEATGYDTFAEIANIYDTLSDSLKETDGVITTAKQKMMLGALNRSLVITRFTPHIEESAYNILLEGDKTAEAFDKYGYTDSQGNKMSVTAEQIRSGVDASLLEKRLSGTISKAESKALSKQIRKALSTNSVLSTLAVADATGRLMIDTSMFTRRVLSGEAIARKADFHNFSQRANAHEINAVSAALGINDWTVFEGQPEMFTEAVAAYSGSDAAKSNAANAARIVSALRGESSAMPMPEKLTTRTSDGMYKYTSADGKTNIALFKEGTDYYIFDYDTGRISQRIGLGKARQVVSGQRTVISGQWSVVRDQKAEESVGERYKRIAETSGITSKVKNFGKLSTRRKNAVRAMIIQARSFGVDEAGILTAAKVSARSGLDIVYDIKYLIPELYEQAPDAKGFDYGYVDGNTIYVNPNTPASRLTKHLLLHEVAHKLLCTKGGKSLVVAAARHIDPERAKKVEKAYRKQYEGSSLSQEAIDRIIEEEILVNCIEDTLSSEDAWQYILGEYNQSEIGVRGEDGKIGDVADESKRSVGKTGLMGRVLAFFRQSESDYDGNLQGEARRLLVTYKRLFDKFSDENGNVIRVERNTSAGDVRHSIRLTDNDIDAYLNAGERRNIKKAEAYALGKKIILTSENEIREYITNSINGDQNTTVAYGMVNDRLANDVMQYSNGRISIHGDYLELVANDIHHAYTEHHISKHNGDIDIGMADFLKLPSYLDNYDDLVYAIKYKSGNTRICVSKKVGSGRILIIEVVSKSRGAIQLKNAIGVTEEKFINEYYNIYKKDSLNPRGSQSSNISLRDSTVSDNTISQNKPVVNTYSMQKSKNNAQIAKKSSDDASDGGMHSINIDDDYMKAVESGDMETAQKMVDEAAVSWGAYLNDEKGNDVFPQTGKARIFYHGTRENFTVFDPRMIGSASGDLGYFGKGHYFAFGKGEASYYATSRGKVIPAYLQMRNPYIYENLYKYRGEQAKGIMGASDAVWAVNMVENFPKLVEDQTVEYAERNDDNIKEMSFSEFAKLFDKIADSVEFTVEKVGGNGEECYIICADATDEVYTDASGKEHKYRDYGFQQRFYDEKSASSKATQVYTYLENRYFSYLELPRPARIIQDMGFSDALREMGYDGILQSEYGDEVVVFDSNQIKSADPVTYDDNGKVIPLSKRFDSSNPDIRFSINVDGKDVVTTSDIEKLRSIGRKSINQFTDEEIKASEAFARRFYKELGTKSPFFRAWFGDWRAYDIGLAQATSISEKAVINNNSRIIHNTDTKWDIQITHDTIGDTIHYAGKERPYLERLLSDIDIVLRRAILLDTAVSSKSSNNKKGSTQFMHYLYSVIEYNGAPFLAKITVEEYDISSKRRAYNVQRIKMSALSRAQYSQMKSAYRGNYASNADGISISDLYELVKRFDKNFSPNPVSPLVCNEDGTPKVFYHGTHKGNNFWAFEKQDNHIHGTALGEGFYFTADYDRAFKYANGIFSKGQDRGGRIIPAYLRMENPFIINSENKTTWHSEITNSNADYDGIIDLTNDTYYTEISANIKSATDNIGTFSKYDPDIRHSINIDGVPAEDIVDGGSPRASGKANMSLGEPRKVIANNMKARVYSKREVLKYINSSSVGFMASNKTKQAYANALWQILNEQADKKYRPAIAHELAKYIMARIALETPSDSVDGGQVAVEAVDALSGGLGRLTFDDELLSELEARFDKDGVRAIKARWGYKKSSKAVKNGASAVSADQWAQEVASESGSLYGHDPDVVNAMDLVIEAIDAYDKYSLVLDDPGRLYFEEASDAEISATLTSIEQDILDAYNNNKLGTKSKYERYIVDRIGWYKLSGRLAYLALTMRDLRIGRFKGASEFDAETFKNTIGKLAKVQFRGNLNVSGTRKLFGELRSWYKSDTVMTNILGYESEKSAGLYVKGIGEMLDSIADGQDRFTNSDLETMQDLMQYFIHFVKTWNKVYRAGKWVDAEQISKDYVKINKQNETVVKAQGKLPSHSYFDKYADPAALIRKYDMYERGFATEIYESLREGAENAAIREMQIMKEYNSFMQSKEGKNYLINAAKEKVLFNGVELSKLQLISIYMSLRRRQAQAHIVYSGAKIYNEKGFSVDIPALAGDDFNTADKLNEFALTKAKQIYSGFTDTDRKYIFILEKIFNGYARDLKVERDMQRLGITNISGDYYFPIRIAEKVTRLEDVDTGEFDRVSNASFNKDTVKGARNRIFIDSADAVMKRHLHAVCLYWGITPTFESFNILYNLNTSEVEGEIRSVKTTYENVWRGLSSYFRKLFDDVQGVSVLPSESKKLIGTIRSGYATSALGLNPKVLLTQLSSVFASSSILDVDCIIKGAVVSAKEVDKYCPLAELRNSDNTAYYAQAVSESRRSAARSGYDSFKNAIMKPIGAVDRFVVCRLFGACQIQVQKNGGAKVGTEANKVEAGKLLRRVIEETQQNSLATERSAAMRSSSELMRAVTMFTADSMKVFGRCYDACGEYFALKKRIRLYGKDAVSTARMKAVKKQVRKAILALMSSALFMALVAKLFRYIYDKDREKDEKEQWHDFSTDFFGNLMGGLPIIKDGYSYFFEGYELQDYTVDTINDIMASAKGMFVTIPEYVIGSADGIDLASASRSLIFTVSKSFGVPTKNAFNIFYGLTKRISPESAYKIDSVFYHMDTRKQFSKALEMGDYRMATFLLGLLTNERLSGDISDYTHDELYRLLESGYSVIPSDIPDKVTVNDEEYELSDDEKKLIGEKYSDACASLDKLVNGSKYKTLSDENKEYAIKRLYSLYRAKAVDDVLGRDTLGNTGVIMSVVSPVNIALADTLTHGITSDKDKNGSLIPGSKKQKVVSALQSSGIPTEDKYLILLAKGYSIKDERVKKILLSYIRKKNISDNSKKLLISLIN